jgi:multiple sugar transport system substrate-binding protein
MRRRASSCEAVAYARVARAPMLLLVLASCGGDSDGGGPVTITELRHDNPPYMKADDEFFADYMKDHANVKIVDTTVKYQTLGSTMLTELKSDRLTADMVRVIPSWVCSFAANLADVPDDVVTLVQARERFFAAPLAGSTCGGKLKALPIEYNLEYGGVVVNVGKYQAKYPGKTPAWATWADFIREAGELTEFKEGKPAANGLDIAPEWPQPAKHIFFSQILQRNGDYWSADKTSFDFKSPAARASFQAMVDWIVTDKVMFPGIVPDRNTFVTTRLAAGATGYGWDDPSKPLAVMAYAGTWALPNTIGQLPAGSNMRFDFYALPPMVNSEHKFVQNSGFALAVPKTSKNQRVAWDIIKALALSAPAMRKWAATAGTLPALKENGTPMAAMADPLLARVQPLLEKGQWVGYIPAAAIETVEGAIVSNFFDAVKGTKTVDQALNDMQETANNALRASP